MNIVLRCFIGEMWAKLAEFAQHVDCVREINAQVVVGCSDLEGNEWGGAVCVVNGNGEQLGHCAQEHGVSALTVHSSSGSAAVVIAGNDVGDIKLLDSATMEVYRSIVAHDSIVSAVVGCNKANGDQRVLSAAWDGL